MLPDISANWPVLSALLDEVLALPPVEREGWLRALPAEHWPLRETLRRLLEVQAGIETRPFLETLPKLTMTSTPVAGLAAGDEVGRYRLLEELGTGGMGCVWLAERADGQLKRKIALKLPRMVWADDLATRMARERDILGALEHPNIARLYDAGVDDKGRPYLALEYVEGQRIDAYCDARRLSVRQRIELFLQVVAAVQYAHVNLVVHRDIKPANVLINQQGAAKLLDFGIARLEVDARMLEELGEAAHTSTRAMTPRYASPEQVRGERLSLVSDVYSLGVLLFELLTGHSPYHLRNDSRTALEIAVTEGDIRPPSRAEITPKAAEVRLSTMEKLAQALRGDLDAILLKALSLEVSNRYLTVQAFGEDLSRWLRGEVILAKRAPAYEVIRKFVMRNRWPVAIASVSIVAVIATAIIAVWQAREARQESRRATATRDFLIALFDDANPELRGGKDVTARELLLEGEKRLPSALASEPDLQAEVLLSIANVWARLGDIDRTTSATARRAEIYRSLGNDRLLMDALIDEAYLASQIGNKEKLNSVLNEIDHRYARSLPHSMTEQSLSELYWLRGWNALTSKKLNQAQNFFVESERISAAIQDTELRIRAKYGQFQTAILLGHRDKALSVYQSSLALLSSSNLSAAERLRRGFELISGLYMLGEFNEGWPEVSRLMSISMELYGADNASQEMLHRYWVNWAIQLEKPDEVISWLKTYRIPIDSCAGQVSVENERWCLLYSRAEAAAGNYSSVSGVFKRLKEKSFSLSKDELFSIDVSEIEALIKIGETDSASRRLESIDLGGDPSGAPSIKRFYYLWFGGVLSLKKGEIPESIGKLRDAESIAKAQFGNNHPRAIQSKMWSGVANLQRLQNDAAYAGLVRSIRSDMSILRRQLGAEHSIIKNVEKSLPNKRIEKNDSELITNNTVDVY